MNYLIFCSFEVGAFPYMMAETLNRHGIKAYYISLAKSLFDHNSTRFHYGDTKDDWDLSSLFDKETSAANNIKILRDIKSRYNIKCALATGGRSYLLRESGIDYRYWSFGADLSEWCRFPVFQPGFVVWKKVILYPYFLLTICREYRKSISNATSLMIAPHQLKVYEQLCPDKRLFFISHLTNVLCYEELHRRKEENRKKVCEAIGADNFFFSSARHMWIEKKDFFVHNKGNNVILHSFACYLKKSGDKKTKLVLIRKGQDVVESEKLIEKLGMHDYVVWFNEMRRDEIWPYYLGSLACFGQFGTPVLSYGVLEPLANAAPCISFFERWNSDTPFYETVPPVFNSIDPEEISSFMCRMTSDIEYASQVSYKSWLWARENCSEEKFVDTFLKEMNR